MTNEELLSVRYKVIADYPESDMPVGAVLVSDEDGIFEYMAKSGNSGFTCTDNINFNRYPHLFKKLEWWEERKVEDMPEYVKIKDKNWLTYGAVYKVDKVLILSRKFVFKSQTSDFSQLDFKDVLPVTEQEYLSYQSKQKS